MTRLEEIDSVECMYLQSLVETLLDPEVSVSCPTVLERAARHLCGELDAEQGVAFHRMPGAPISRGVCVDVADRTFDEYSRRYHTGDPMVIQLSRLMSEGAPHDLRAAARTLDDLTGGSPTGTRYFRSFLAPAGIRHVLGAMIRTGGEGEHWSIGLLRRPGRPGVTEAARRELELLASVVGLTLGRVAATREERSLELDALTPREREVALCVARGRRNRDVATEFGISVRTVENHLRVVFEKLGVASRSELAARVAAHAPA